MTATVIGPETFDFLFFLFVLIIGLDYTWSGYLIITNKTNDKRKRWLLGLWIIQRMQSNKRIYKNFGWPLSFMYDYRNMGFMCFVGGILITFGSAIMIVDLLL